jgi:hypothetical protein
MPQVMRVDGYTFHIYLNDHPPPHVHVFRSGTRCVILIGDADSAPSLRDSGDMKPIDARRAIWMVADTWELLLIRWRKLHAGPDA